MAIQISADQRTFTPADKIKLISDGSRRIRRAAASVLWKKDRGRKS